MPKLLIPGRRADYALQNALVVGTPSWDRCPHLRKDPIGPYCGRDLKGENISGERRRICDSASLQLWCLDKERYNRCIWYQGERFRE